jgi:hypothetical protein|uniref:MYM-type domain-containing protein n=1 Tax=viral metagenome TaxID=1070528 RepID=A0A6C0K395_9ZZZZ
MPRGQPKSKSDENTVVEPKKARVSKRAAKANAVAVVAVISPDGQIHGTFSPEPRRPLIVHLPFRSTEVTFKDGPLAYDPTPPTNPQAYDAAADDLYVSNSEILNSADDQPIADTPFPATIRESEVVVASATQAPVVEEKQIKAFRTIDIMIDYRVANETMSVPESTTTACYWCCGQFDGRPVVLPTEEETGIYTVYGNFCTLPCGLSYLLQEHIDPQVRWERQALYHRMYKQFMNIQPAPPRESLIMFGGALSHEQYRDIISKQKLRVDYNNPPVVSILATLDTKPIDFYETSLRNTTTGTGVDIMKPVEPGLRLKRSKPLKDKDSTLDAVMNLHVRVKN